MITYTLKEQIDNGADRLFVKGNVVCMKDSNLWYNVIEEGLDYCLFKDNDNELYYILVKSTGDIICGADSYYIDSEEELEKARAENEDIIKLFRKYRLEEWSRNCW